MPTLNKTTSAGEAEKRVEKTYISREHACWSGWCANGGDFGKKILLTLACIFLVYAIFLLGALVRNNLKKYDSIGYAEKSERTISVTGRGKVSAENNIATVTMGYANTAKDVASGQEANKKVMDGLLQELKAMSIDSKDIETSNYSVYPDYTYLPDKGQELKGYRISSSVTVKVRDVNKVSAVLALAGKYGANEVSGPNYTIDDPENLKSEARSQALDDAKQKAYELAQSLGVKVVGLVNYSEYEDYGPQPYYGKAMDVGFGGGAAPELASGSKDVIVNVNIIYEIAPKYRR